jgi:hypothetical protein
MATQTLDNMATQTTDEGATQTIDIATLSGLALDNIAHPIKLWGLEMWQIGLILLAILAITAALESGLWCVARVLEYIAGKGKRRPLCTHDCRSGHQKQHNVHSSKEISKKWSEGRSYIDWESDDEVEDDSAMGSKLHDEPFNNAKQNSRIKAAFLGILQFLTWPYSCSCQRACDCWLSQETWNDGGEKVAERANREIKDEEKGLLEEY